MGTPQHGRIGSQTAMELPYHHGEPAQVATRNTSPMAPRIGNRGRRGRRVKNARSKTGRVRFGGCVGSAGWVYWHSASKITPFNIESDQESEGVPPIPTAETTGGVWLRSWDAVGPPGTFSRLWLRLPGHVTRGIRSSTIRPRPPASEPDGRLGALTLSSADVALGRGT